MPAPDRVPQAGPPSVAGQVPAAGAAVSARPLAGVAGFRAKVSRRALDVLPPGTLTVGAGLLVLGAGYYAHLAVAGHSLPASGMAALSVLWSIVFLLGLGVFLPVEQELIRPSRNTMDQSTDRAAMPEAGRLCPATARWA